MAGQDYKRHIPAGGSTRINANGETYIFCKFSDRDVTVDIAGRKVVMRTGSYMEFAPLRGENSAVTIYNEDTENPAAIVLVMGVGTYDEKIINGNVSVTPKRQSADGTWIDDTSYPISLNLVFDTGFEPVEYNAAQRTDNVFRFDNTGTQQKIALGPGRKTLCINKERINDGLYKQVYSVYDPIRKNKVSEFKLLDRGGGLGSNDVSIGALSHIGGNTWICFEPSDTRITLRTENTGVDWGVTPSNSYALDCDYDQETGRLYAVIRSKLSNPTELQIWNFSTKQTIKRINLQAITGQSYPQNVQVFENEVYVYGGGKLYKIDTENETATAVLSGIDHEWQIKRIGRNLYTNEVGPNSWVHKIAAVPYAINAKGYATVGRGGDAMVRLFKPVSYQFETSANVKLTQTQDGVIIEGEVIKAALEMYYRKEVPENYMDCVFGFEAINLGDMEDTPQQSKTISNGPSFAALKIKDQFSAKMPGYVTLIIDNRLKFEG